MGLFPRKYCNQNHIQSQLNRRQKMMTFHDDTQNLKFFLNQFTELSVDNHFSSEYKAMGLFPSKDGIHSIMTAKFINNKSQI